MTFLSEPSLLVALIEVAIGIVLLAKAADLFVDGAANIASLAKVSPVLVGAVIVGFGTSAPELLVSGIAASNGELALGVGNIVGSNVANLSLVLGAAAFIVPLRVTRSVLIRESPLSMLSVLAFAYVTLDGLEQWEGFALLAGLVAALSWVILGGMATEVPEVAATTSTTAAGSRVAGAPSLAEPPQTDGVTEPDVEETSDEGRIGVEALRAMIGLLGTVIGAQTLVWGAIGLATAAGLTGGFIGFTLVAVGTSFPELVTAIVAARKGATELLIGNLLGSNLFNSLAVGGAIAVIDPGSIGDRGLATIGVGVMVVVAVGAWLAMATLRRVHRTEAVLLLLGWLVAIVLLARTASVEHTLGALAWVLS